MNVLREIEQCHETAGGVQDNTSSSDITSHPFILAAIVFGSVEAETT